MNVYLINIKCLEPFHHDMSPEPGPSVGVGSSVGIGRQRWNKLKEPIEKTG